jgi:hypothetical protein
MHSGFSHQFSRSSRVYLSGGVITVMSLAMIGPGAAKGGHGGTGGPAARAEPAPRAAAAQAPAALAEAEGAAGQRQQRHRRPPLDDGGPEAQMPANPPGPVIL